ncbi:hypothetical protein Sjap_006151 [Stephania japonica]|uniref:Uncharacterized protein n=1 Tax=Stephania japonica TaxID=461633 RepID=A0AAP0K5B3_9MAGN
MGGEKAKEEGGKGETIKKRQLTSRKKKGLGATDQLDVAESTSEPPRPPHGRW